MPIKLDAPARNVDITAAEYQPMLHGLQANIIKPHGRDFARHIFLRFTAQPLEVRAWIRSAVAARITTAHAQFAQIAQRKRDKTFDGGPIYTFALAAAGYAYLGFDIEAFASEAFRHGMKHRSRNLIKDILDTNNKDPKPQTWEAGFQAEVHALVAIADDREDVVRDAAEALIQTASGIGDVLSVQEGIVLRRKIAEGRYEPVEHFGYFDGISNPIFTRQDLEEDLVENRERAEWDPGARLSLVLVDDPFGNEVDGFGSYLVYRKLAQDYALFTQRVAALSKAIPFDPTTAGAMVIGRFQDGTPLAKHGAAGPGHEVENDFNFDEDKAGVRCPVHAHIRKVNPRGTTPLMSLEAERKRRIVRRGIPYGIPMPGVADGAPVNGDPTAERGLLFMCFQHNIEDQFEFIQRAWVDNEHFPSAVLTLGLLQKDPGDDSLIGQDRDEAQRWPKAWGNEEPGKKSFNFESAVTLRGGEYLFAPSVPFLKGL